MSFTARIDVLGSMGSEYYAYFQVGSEHVRAGELEELALDAGATEVGQSRERTVTFRLRAHATVAWQTAVAAVALIRLESL